MLNEAKSAVDDLKYLADGQRDDLGDVCNNAVDIIEKYQQLSMDAVSVLHMLRVELQYALQAFQDQCQCNHCGSCNRQRAFESALSAEKKIWNKLI